MTVHGSATAFRLVNEVEERISHVARVLIDHEIIADSIVYRLQRKHILFSFDIFSLFYEERPIDIIWSQIRVPVADTMSNITTGVWLEIR